jgi:hypothetical protein
LLHRHFAGPAFRVLRPAQNLESKLPAVQHFGSLKLKTQAYIQEHRATNSLSSGAHDHLLFHAYARLEDDDTSMLGYPAKTLADNIPHPPHPTYGSTTFKLILFPRKYFSTIRLVEQQTYFM